MLLVLLLLLYLASASCAADRSIDVEAIVDCCLNQSHSTKAEDLILLPTLLGALSSRRGSDGDDGPFNGTFLEMGAFDGTTSSNTWMLEKCLGWRGLLLEASPSNFQRLLQSERKATMVHTAACKKGVGSIEISELNGENSGDMTTITKTRQRRARSKNGTVLLVPCKPLSSILAEHGFSRIDFFSLDVEGAEFNVLESFDQSTSWPFGVVLLESVHPTTTPPARRFLERVGMRRANATLYPHVLPIQGYRLPMNDIWLQEHVVEHAMSVHWTKASYEWTRSAGKPWNVPPTIERHTLIQTVRNVLGGDGRRDSGHASGGRGATLEQLTLSTDNATAHGHRHHRAISCRTGRCRSVDSRYARSNDAGRLKSVRQ